MHRASFKSSVLPVRWPVALGGFSTWQDSRLHSRFLLLLRCGPQTEIGSPWPHHPTPPCPSLCPCHTDPHPLAAAHPRTVAPRQGAPPPRKKMALVQQWWEDSKPKLPRREGLGEEDLWLTREWRSNVIQTDFPGPVCPSFLCSKPSTYKLMGKS